MTDLSDEQINQIVERVVQGALAATPMDAVAAGSDGAGSAGVIALGADHGGFRMKQMLMQHLSNAGHTLLDCGTDNTEPVDYPDFALAVAGKVASGDAWRGIIVDGAGIGSCMVANKVRGVRAAMCFNHSTALNSREHNDANVLTLGAGQIGDTLAVQLVDLWLSASFGGGRHARRVEKIMAVEGLEAASK
jgi:ribose 5-phosphate isomerase B